ncbi:MAG TPA: VIT1/CCC1 family protein [Acidimicrobiia bacterium]|nr:VIT1/CCC1 family protein [Acidimicrobiia bacterium]
MTVAAPDAKRLEHIQEMYADEIAGGTLFRGLAEYADDDRKRVFLQLADAEERHAEHWARLLLASGVEPKRPRTPFRVRALCFLARHLGTEAVLPLMLRTEAAEADRYRADSEATPAMAKQEAAAGRTIAAMQGIPAGGRIARSEGRHRASVGGVLRASVFGMNDGLISNFSLVMGVAGGTTTKGIVVLAGVAGLVAGAFSMASGEWISIRSQRELYENELRIEREELRAFPEEEREELELIYRAKGITPEAARVLVDNIMRRSDVALDTLAREELGLDPARLGSPWVAALSSFLAFSIGALIPLIPFLIGSGTAATIVSAAVSVVALFTMGAITSIFTGRDAGKSGLRMAAIGVVVATVTFFIGKAIGTSV